MKPDRQLRFALLRNKLAVWILACEAAYFVGAVAYLTVFGIKVAHGESIHHGFLETTTLPIVAVGIFVVWALAITFVLEFNQVRMRSQERVPDGHSAVSKIGFYTVLGLHLIIGAACYVNARPVIGSAVLFLGLLLGLCGLASNRFATQFRSPSKDVQHV